MIVHYIIAGIVSMVALVIISGFVLWEVEAFKWRRKERVRLQLAREHRLKEWVEL